ncbi:DUF2911 domain-containing protein [Roseivirga sp. BDSF3-8]|uniref:DUF2911 domain-containing protein n=1 Tax=Roseivirga sp. BDSF3-8 TaxID=3241598 RepID=UPI0035321EB2
MLRRIFLLAICCIGLGLAPTMAQDSLTPEPSPLEVVSVKLNDLYMKVVYSRPHMRGRDIFGGLVPYGEVWRTGANEATEITLTEDVIFGGKELPAGTYAIFTIPNEDSWTVIVNTDLGQWGAFKYNEELNLFTFEVPVEKTDVAYEPFTITFDLNKDSVSMNMIWDRTKVTIPIEPQ